MNTKEAHFRSFRGETLSTGADVQVFLVKFTKDTIGQPKYAVMKQYRNKSITFDREVAILQELCGLHPNIVTYYHHILTSQKCFIFLEHCRKGSLADEIHRRSLSSEPWSDSELTHHYESLTSAMVLIHDRRIVHRDLKPENIFVTDTGEMKIGDFGEAKQVRNGRTNEDATLRGTWEYLSPGGVRASREVGSVSNGECAEDDVWMMGRTFYEMAVCTRRPDLNPLTPSTASSVYHELESTMHASNRSASLTSLVLSMLSLDPRDRPTFLHLLQLLQSGNSAVCNRCGAVARRREPFQCSHILCAGCYLSFLEYIRDQVSSLSQLVCPLCYTRISPGYFQKHDFDPGATAKVNTLHLLSKTVPCPFCFNLHPKYRLVQAAAEPYLLECKGQKACSHCLKAGGHGGESAGRCPGFTNL